MATKLDFKTLLTKIVTVFPKDVYFVHNWCAVAGGESDIENRGLYICILDSNVRELLDKLFPSKPVLYIKNIREIKGDVTKVDEIINDNTIKNLESLIDSFMTSVNSYTEWKTFNFSEEEINTLFEDNTSLTLFENEENKYPLIISKSVFPLITGKTINDVKYVYDEYNDDNKELNQVIMTYDYELFQLVMRYLFLKI